MQFPGGTYLSNVMLNHFSFGYYIADRGTFSMCWIPQLIMRSILLIVNSFVTKIGLDYFLPILFVSSIFHKPFDSWVLPSTWNIDRMSCQDTNHDLHYSDFMNVI